MSYSTFLKTKIGEGAWSGFSKRPRQNLARRFVNMATAHTSTNILGLVCAIHDDHVFSRQNDGLGCLGIFHKQMLTEERCAHSQRMNTPWASFLSLGLCLFRATYQSMESATNKQLQCDSYSHVGISRSRDSDDVIINLGPGHPMPG